MLILRTIASLTRARAQLRGSVALVPTMGALHEGHLSLVRVGKGLARNVIVSLFVNPLQFGPREDFQNYPRRERADARALWAAGVRILFAPSSKSFYPDGFATGVSVRGRLARVYEGALRPGHFDGVATVVARLLGLTKPDFGIFGEKDLQQLAVIRKLCEDLNLGPRVVGAPIVRDGGGLALSSRNEYLSSEDIRKARTFHAALLAGRAVAREPGARRGPVLNAVRRVLAREPALTLAYLGLVDPLTFEECKIPLRGRVLVASVRISGVRLLDNARI